MKPSLLPKTSLLSRLGLALISVVAVVAGFAIASLLLTVLMVAGLGFAGWLWWRLRRLAQRAQRAAPTVIEGEFTVVPEYRALEDQSASGPVLSRFSTRENRRAS